MAVTLAVILGKNTFYDIRDMRFSRFKQYDEILHGAVACTDIHTADILPDGLFHILQRLLNGFDIRNCIHKCLDGDHHQITSALAANMIGVKKNIIIVNMGFIDVVMFNPVIVSKHDMYETEEGCLSLDGVRKTTRYQEIEVE